MRRRLGIVLLAAAAALAGMARAEQDKSAPRIRVEPESFDFGRSLPGKSLRRDFTLPLEPGRWEPCLTGWFKHVH